MMDEETYLREMLAMLQEDYRKTAKPYIDRLIYIDSCKPPRPMFVSYKQFQKTGIPEALKPEIQDTIKEHHHERPEGGSTTRGTSPETQSD